MPDIIYYYSINEFTITGEADEHASIKNINTSGLIETVEYDQDSNKVYVKAADGYTISKVYKYTGDQITGDYSAKDGEQLTIQTERGRAKITDGYKAWDISETEVF